MKIIGIGNSRINTINLINSKNIANTKTAIICANKSDLERVSADQKLLVDSISDISIEKSEKVILLVALGGKTGNENIISLANKINNNKLAIVTTPFPFEGSKRRDLAEKTINGLKEKVDVLIVINNGEIQKTYDNLSIDEAFHKSDDIILQLISEVLNTAEDNLQQDYNTKLQQYKSFIKII